ncbi:hypothetical protein F7725_003382 [Dissostichus mawsoni]|uniref:Uncharacterized protein n=1 Tax=Dissostichus mawsoni TaxID=36200 RepID=A0A7J5YA68_DISMA|nr:hypothetical protein F7725_003382 [Dissostichus mawsoni]
MVRTDYAVQAGSESLLGLSDSQQPKRGPPGLSYFPFFHLNLNRQEEALTQPQQIPHRHTHHTEAMGSVSELCVSSLQTFLCPAMKPLQQAPAACLDRESRAGQIGWLKSSFVSANHSLELSTEPPFTYRRNHSQFCRSETTCNFFNSDLHGDSMVLKSEDGVGYKSPLHVRAGCTLQHMGPILTAVRAAVSLGLQRAAGSAEGSRLTHKDMQT